MLVILKELTVSCIRYRIQEEFKPYGLFLCYCTKWGWSFFHMHLINRLCIIPKEEFISIGLHLFCDLKSLNFHCYSAYKWTNISIRALFKASHFLQTCLTITGSWRATNTDKRPKVPEWSFLGFIKTHLLIMITAWRYLSSILVSKMFHCYNNFQ